MPFERTPTKIAIVGVGAVGATAAYALMISGLAEEIVLVDVNEQKAEGEAMDLAHGLPFVRPVSIRAGKYADCAGGAGGGHHGGGGAAAGRDPLDLLKRNAAIFQDMVPQIAQAAPDAILLIVANPVDILTLCQRSGFRASRPDRVIGSGTVLDTGRLRSLVGQRLRVDAAQRARLCHRRTRRQRGGRLEPGDGCGHAASASFVASAAPPCDEEMRARDRQAGA